MKKPIIIVLRGNSGSGKSTVAKMLQEKFGRGTLLISQDDVRIEMLCIRGGADSKSIKLLYHLAQFGSNNCDVTILEGIMPASEHEELFEQINMLFEGRVFAYYFDLPFDETLKRHEQKQQAKLHNFGETEMKKWWRDKDFSAKINESIITKDMSLNDIVKRIFNDVQKFGVKNLDN